MSRPGSKAKGGSSRPGSNRAMSRPGSKALVNAGGQSFSRPGSRARATQSPPVKLGSAGRMTPNTFTQTLSARSATAAFDVFEEKDPHYEDIPQFEFEAFSDDGVVDGARPPCTFANTGVGIGDWKERQEYGPTKLANQNTLPLQGNWHNHRTKYENFALYNHQPKFDALQYRTSGQSRYRPGALPAGVM